MTDFSERWQAAIDAVGSGDFDPQGANASYSFTTVANTLPSVVPGLPSTFAPSSTSPGAIVTSKGSGSGTFDVASASPTTAQIPSNAAAGSSPSPAGGIVSGSVTDYFLRAVIIILGFIFVAVGLNMFKPGTVPVPGLPGRRG